MRLGESSGNLGSSDKNMNLEIKSLEEVKENLLFLYYH